MTTPSSELPANTEVAIQGDLFSEMPLDEYAVVIAAQRAVNLARIAQTEASTTWQAGGAFGGAMKRRIKATNSAALYAETTEHDINLIDPQGIAQRLFGYKGALEYSGVVFTPMEFSALTFSPEAHGKRVGARVFAGTTERLPDDRYARRDEVTIKALKNQKAKAAAVRSGLEEDMRLLGMLAKEMTTPGYSHMTRQRMDGLMEHAEATFLSMFDAILINQAAPNDRFHSLKSALEYRLSGDDYHQTLVYWRQMVGLASAWEREKIRCFQTVERNIQTQLDK